jgi:hypothetical protein
VHTGSLYHAVYNCEGTPSQKEPIGSADNVKPFTPF